MAAAGVTIMAPETTELVETMEPWLEVDLGRIERNARAVARHAGGRPLVAVVKDEAYGHGLVPVARRLETLEETHSFAVVKVREALSLREAGVRKPILHLGPAAAPELAELARSGVTPAVFSDCGAVLARIAREIGRTVPIQLYVDTGMGRAGVPWREALDLAKALAARPEVRFTGVFTELGEEDEQDREQVARLATLHRDALAAGIDLGPRHAASSSAVFHVPEAWLDLVRPGIALYGAYPDLRAQAGAALRLEPAAALKGRVSQVKRLAPGESLQYHRAYVANRPVWVASVAVGHCDGWPKETAGRCEVAVDGRRYPAIAAVSANHMLFEVGDDRTVDVGDEVVFFGQSKGVYMDPHVVAARTGVSVYSLLMHLGSQLPRRYLG